MAVFLDRAAHCKGRYGVKSCIIMTASPSAVGRSHTTNIIIDLGFHEGELPRKLQLLRRIFPDEQAFKPSNSMSEDEF